MQTPEHIIEIKLNPMIQGLSRAVNNFTKGAEAHAKAVDTNLKATQSVANSITALVAELRAARPATGAAPSVPPPKRSGSKNLKWVLDILGARSVLRRIALFSAAPSQAAWLTPGIARQFPEQEPRTGAASAG
jgi:hypothetical protein